MHIYFFFLLPKIKTWIIKGLSFQSNGGGQDDSQGLSLQAHLALGLASDICCNAHLLAQKTGRQVACILWSMSSTCLCAQISFGGVAASAKPSSGGRENFVGCMEGIIYNGDNITNLVRRKKVDTSSFVRHLLQCVFVINVLCVDHRWSRHTVYKVYVV